jgi:hypothetical protein
MGVTLSRVSVIIGMLSKLNFDIYHSPTVLVFIKLGVVWKWIRLGWLAILNKH